MNCAKCNAELKPVFELPQRRRDDWSVQYDNALGVQFIGGYGMFDDPLALYHQRERTAVLCHGCAHQFLKDNPWVPIVAGHGHAGVDYADPKHGHGHE